MGLFYSINSIFWHRNLNSYPLQWTSFNRKLFAGPNAKHHSSLPAKSKFSSGISNDSFFPLFTQYQPFDCWFDILIAPMYVKYSSEFGCFLHRFTTALASCCVSNDAMSNPYAMQILLELTHDERKYLGM